MHASSSACAVLCSASHVGTNVSFGQKVNCRRKAVRVSYYYFEERNGMGCALSVFHEATTRLGYDTVLVAFS